MWRAWRKMSRRTGAQCGMRLFKNSPAWASGQRILHPMAATMIEALREEVTALEAELSQKLDDTPSGVLCGSDSTASGLEEQITRNDVGAYQSSPRCLPLDNAKLKRNSRRRSGVQFEQVVASLPPAIGSGEGAVCCATASGQDMAGKLEEPSSRTPHNAMAAALAPARLPSSGSTSSVPKRTSSVDRPHRTASSDSTNSKKVDFMHFTPFAHSLEWELGRWVCRLCARGMRKYSEILRLQSAITCYADMSTHATAHTTVEFSSAVYWCLETRTVLTGGNETERCSIRFWAEDSPEKSSVHPQGSKEVGMSSKYARTHTRAHSQNVNARTRAKNVNEHTNMRQYVLVSHWYGMHTNMHALHDSTLFFVLLHNYDSKRFAVLQTIAKTAEKFLSSSWYHLGFEIPASCWAFDSMTRSRKSPTNIVNLRARFCDGWKSRIVTLTWSFVRFFLAAVCCHQEFMMKKSRFRPMPESQDPGNWVEP